MELHHAFGALRVPTWITSDVPDKRENNAPADDELEGRYANHFRIGHNAYEFVLDFGQLYTGGGPARYHTRIAMSPRYANALLSILQEAVDGHVGTYGPIDERQVDGYDL